MTHKQHWRTLAAVVVLVIVGFALRLHQIGAVSFRGDEAFTILNWIEPPLATTIASDIPTADPQPLLAYVVFHIWGHLFGTDETVVRLLPALIGTLIIPVMYALGRRIAGWRLGLLAAAFATVHPFLIWHAQDARNYALWATFSALALWLGLRAVESQRWRDRILYVAAATAAAYLYYLELFFIATLTLYVVLRYHRQRPVILNWLATLTVIGLLLAPWYLQPRLLSGGGYSGTAGTFDPVQIITWFLPSLMFGRTLPTAFMQALGPLILLVLLAGGVLLWRCNRWYALLLGMLSTLPLLMLSVVALRLNVFTPRYVLASSAAFMLLTGMAIIGINAWQPYSRIKRIGSAVFMVAVATIIGISLNNHYGDFDYTKAPDWRGLTTYLHAVVQPDDLVIQTAADEAFTYYYRDFTDIERLPANPIQSDDEITGILDADRSAYDSLWLVASPPAGWANAQTGRDWLDSHMQLIRSLDINGLPVRQYMDWDVTPAHFNAEPAAVFDDVAHLLHVEILAYPGPELTVLTYWQAINPTNDNVKAFAHLTTEDSALPLAQDDQYMQDGRIDTTNWQPGKIYRDVYHIPVQGLLSGDYVLRIGLYHPETGERIITDRGSDSYTVGPITLP